MKATKSFTTFDSEVEISDHEPYLALTVVAYSESDESLLPFIV